MGLDSVKLKLAPDDNNAPYLAAFYAMGDLAYGVSTVTTGWLSDRWQANGTSQVQVFAALFLAGWIGRTLVAALLVPLEEPGAWRLRDIFGSRRAATDSVSES